MVAHICSSSAEGAETGAFLELSGSQPGQIGEFWDSQRPCLKVESDGLRYSMLTCGLHMHGCACIHVHTRQTCSKFKTRNDVLRPVKPLLKSLSQEHYESQVSPVYRARRYLKKRNRFQWASYKPNSQDTGTGRILRVQC